MGRQGRLASPGHDLSRRRLLRLGGIGGLVSMTASSLSGCDLLSTDPAAEGGSGEGKRKQAMEAPKFAELVKRGDLPEVEKRLPEHPLVVDTVEGAGSYGGTWHSAILGPTDTSWLHRTVGHELLLRWTPDYTEHIPNLAESFELSPDASQVTIKLRKGVRWSDGQPFVAKDITFAVNDVLNDPEVSPSSKDNPDHAEELDEHTVKITFAEPQGLWPHYQAGPAGVQLVIKPFHYCKKFHKKYNPDVQALVDEAGMDNWVDLLASKGGGLDTGARFVNTELPQLTPWLPQNSLGEGTEITFARNPYYWKTDTDGRQLPYIDKVRFKIISDVQVMLTRALHGDIDMHVRHFNVQQNKPVLARNRKKGGYGFFDTTFTYMNPAMISLNLTHQDPAKRKLFQSKEFRIGLSHAINRKEIIEAVFQRQGEPWQGAPRPDADFYNEELAKQYTEYDVTRANEHLDRSGVAERGTDGNRIGPDGKKISFAVEYPTNFRPSWPGTLELVQRYWRKVGVDTRIKPVARSLFYERKEANKHDANVWQGDGGLKDGYVDPRWYIPISTESNYAIPWANWWTSDGAEGEEPPTDVRDHLAIYDRLKATSDPHEQLLLMKQIVAQAVEQFYAIGINLFPPGYGIVANDMHNVPDHMYESYRYQTPGPTNPEQYYFQA